jgi:hypothetical protein
VCIFKNLDKKLGLKPFHFFISYFCRSDFVTLSPVLLLEHPVVLLLLERVLISWSSAINEHGE